MSDASDQEDPHDEVIIQTEDTTYRVPLVDPDTGDGWDVEVEAEGPHEAIQKATEQAGQEVHVASTFVRDHWGDDDA